MDIINKISLSYLANKQTALMKYLSKLSIELGVGKHVYVVGGAVRNFLIDRPIKDIDIVVDSVNLGKDSEWFAKQVAKHIPVRTDLTTNQYGVAILTVKEDWILEDEQLKGEIIEIANARKESYGGSSGKGYKPHMVEPATIDEDIFRREFRFNTLLWRLMDLTEGPEKAEVIDLTGCGLKDLREGVMNCPIDPDKVLKEDPTRCLRAVKFVSKYGFKIPPDLMKAIQRNAHKMKQAPWEAIGTLLVENILSEPTARDALKLMKKLGLLDVIAEMVKEQQPFATYLSRSIKDKDVQLLLDMMDLGLDVKSPISFLSRSQQQRLRDITTGMSTEDAQAYLKQLQKPPIDNMKLIEMYHIPPQQRGILASTAREFILEHPEYAFNNNVIQEYVERALK